jgi:hypothetical protein
MTQISIAGYYFDVASALNTDDFGLKAVTRLRTLSISKRRLNLMKLLLLFLKFSSSMNAFKIRIVTNKSCPKTTSFYLLEIPRAMCVLVDASNVSFIAKSFTKKKIFPMISYSAK